MVTFFVDIHSLKWLNFAQKFAGSENVLFRCFLLYSPCVCGQHLFSFVLIKLLLPIKKQVVEFCMVPSLHLFERAE